MRTLVLSAALLASADAYAGGIGVLLHGGAHTEKAFFYSNHDPETDTPINVATNYPQFEQTQFVPQFGGGFEFILGDRDDRIQGVFRGYYSMDAAQSDPADSTTEINSEYVVSEHRTVARHVGMASMGLNWGAIGSTDGFQLGVSAHIGAGALTNDHSEFFQLMVGPTANYRLSNSVIGFADLHYIGRFRKGYSHGTQAMVGMRFMFD